MTQRNNPEFHEDILIYTTEKRTSMKLQPNTMKGAQKLASFFDLPIHIGSNRFSATKWEVQTLQGSCALANVSSVWVSEDN